MSFGNEIEHLAEDAKHLGQAETMWLMLRNVYFREGTPEEAWQTMVNCFAGMGVHAISEWRYIKGQKERFVLLTRLHTPSQAQ